MRGVGGLLKMCWAGPSPTMRLVTDEVLSPIKNTQPPAGGGITATHVKPPHGEASWARWRDEAGAG